MQSRQNKGVSLQEESPSLASHTSFVNQDRMSPKTKYPVQEPRMHYLCLPQRTFHFFGWDLILPLFLPSFELLRFQVEKGLDSLTHTPYTHQMHTVQNPPLHTRHPSLCWGFSFTFGCPPFLSLVHLTGDY